MGNLEIEELPSGVQAITGVATSIALFIGWTPDGPTDRALRLFGFADYERNYGGLDSRSLLGYSVRHFYDNGGSNAYVMRIAGNDGAVIDPNDAGFHAALEKLFVAGGAVDSIELFNIICMPGLADTAAIQAMQQRARERRAFLIVDCGEADTVATVTGSLTGKIGADAPNSAFYFPWVVAPDPLQQNTPRAFPPCGFVAGIFARVDASRGVWKAPAGIEALLAGHRLRRRRQRCRERPAQSPRDQLPAQLSRRWPCRVARAYARWRRQPRLGVEICTGAALRAFSRAVHL